MHLYHITKSANQEIKYHKNKKIQKINICIKKIKWVDRLIRRKKTLSEDMLLILKGECNFESRVMQSMARDGISPYF